MHFLQAVAIGGPALTKFEDEWAMLLADIDYDATTTPMDNATTAFRSAVATRIMLLSEHLLDFQIDAEAMEAGFEGELESIFARVDINDTSNPIPPTSTSPIPSDTSVISIAPQDRPAPPYIEPAYKWLLNNLHNPYPSKEIRNAIHLETGSSRKTIDSWFIDTRKRIGWNALRRRRFSNKRVEIVEAATRFFLQGEPGSSGEQSEDSNPNDNVDFASIETRAKALYSEKYLESTLAVTLDASVKDLTPQTKAEARSAESLRRKRGRRGKSQGQYDVQAASSYPSPERSVSGTPEPTLLPPTATGGVFDAKATGSNLKRGIDLEKSERPNKRSRCVIFPFF